MSVFSTTHMQLAGALVPPQHICAGRSCVPGSSFAEMAFPVPWFLQRMACACLFLATKLEESHKRTRDILMVFDRINKRRDYPPGKPLPLLIPETRVSLRQLI